MTAFEKIAKIEAQIEALGAKLADARIKAANEVDPAGIVDGATVTFNYGRAEKARVLTGVVLGIKAAGAKGADVVKVQVGTGVDTEVLSIFKAQVTKIEGITSEEQADPLAGEAQ